MSNRQCYNICVGYAATLSITQACIDKGLHRNTLSKYWRFFRCAEAYMGSKFRGEFRFEGTAACPAEVEADEAVFRKVAVFADGRRTGTVHWEPLACACGVAGAQWHT